MKKVCLYIPAFILSGIFYTNCEDDGPGKRDWPRINTLEVTNISEKGAQLNAEITSREDYIILKYGFVWSESENPALENSDKVVFADKISLNNFSAEISTTLKSGEIYYVKSFIETKDYTIYGNEVSFESLGSQAPLINLFSPSSGSWGDTIMIYGKNFSFVSSKNVVYFGEIKGTVLYATDTLLITQVPSIKNNPEVSLSVSILGNNATSSNSFKYLIPEILDISTLTGTYNDSITIYGMNFSRLKEFNSVFFNEIEAEICSFSTTHIEVQVPELLNVKESSIRVTSVGHSGYVDEPFILKSPSIAYFKPDTVFKPHELITIFGTNFCPITLNNKVLIGGYYANILESSTDNIKVYLPDQIIPEYNISVFKNVSIQITTAQQSNFFSDSLPVWWHSTWTRKRDFPGLARHNAVAFALGSKGYFGTGLTQGSEYLDDFWEYDPMSDQWTQTASLPGGPRAASVAFTVDSKGYVGLGTEAYRANWWEDNSNYYRDFYSYDPSSGSWTKISDFSGFDRYSAASFTIDSEGYVGTGWWGKDGPEGSSKITNDFWKYNPLVDSWSEVQSFPLETDMAVGFNIGTSGYIYCYDFLYKFDGSTWIKLDAVSLSAWDNIAFSINGKAYFGMGVPHQNGGTNDLWEYDPSTQTSTNRPISENYRRWGASVFVINNKAYIIGGDTYKDEEIFLKDVWEFDPSKPKINK